MNKFFIVYKKYENLILYFVILTCFIWISYSNLSIGYIMSSDSKTYSRWADDLIRLDFNLYSYYIQNTFGNPNFIYTIPVFLIALIKLLFGTAWQYAFMIFNLTLVFFSLIIYSKILLLLNIRLLIISITMPLLALSVDLLIWPRYILTDTVFSFLILFTIYFIIKNIVNKKLSFFSIIFLIILMFLTRPTSLPYIFAIIFFITILKFNINFTPKLSLLFIFLLFILTPFIFAILYQLMKNHLNEISQVKILIAWVEAGQIIHDRPETWVKNPDTFFDLVYLYFVRIIFFFKPYFESFSKIHNILNVFQAFIVLLSISLWFFLGQKYNSINKTITLILFISFSVAAFHAFTIIDYDWRYRYPVIMPLLIIFPISIEIYLRNVCNNKLKY